MRAPVGLPRLSVCVRGVRSSRRRSWPPRGGRPARRRRGRSTSLWRPPHRGCAGTATRRIEGERGDAAVRLLGGRVEEPAAARRARAAVGAEVRRRRQPEVDAGERRQLGGVGIDTEHVEAIAFAVDVAELLGVRADDEHRRGRLGRRAPEVEEEQVAVDREEDDRRDHRLRVGLARRARRRRPPARASARRRRRRAPRAPSACRRAARGRASCTGTRGHRRRRRRRVPAGFRPSGQRSARCPGRRGR